MLELLKNHGYAALFLVILGEQMGIPLPAVPVIVTAGALVGLGILHPVPVLVAVLCASLIADLSWYELGRRKGASVLKFLCQVALEPEACIHKTENVFEKYGDRCLLFAKFVPGLYTVTPPVAGMVGLSLRRFILMDSLGILIWSTVYLGLGFALRTQLEELLARLEGMGATLFQIAAGVMGLFVIFKLLARWQFLRRLRTARIDVGELKAMLDQGLRVVIADLRSDADRTLDPVTIPGAQVLGMEELDRLPRDQDIILYCT